MVAAGLVFRKYNQNQKSKVCKLVISEGIHETDEAKVPYM
ncbi:protein of unknown function [Candidatus Nitrosocosmicus franklandus]|uniref:Uncharacterized protein n=1 Tax=Candidatus Nitrosocosmicus franklandianus TaxID=1798806 RepID=A0A484I6K2_9ARCH|nr:protein of unknown function [Candidatus Nitrosocosmicus franklandus]